MSHPRKALDPVIHAPVRFSIMAALAAVDEADFKTLAATIEVADSALSKQLATLNDAGYLKLRKAFVGKYPRTYASLTPEGRTAWAQHLAALQMIASELTDSADSRPWPGAER